MTVNHTTEQHDAIHDGANQAASAVAAALTDIPQRSWATVQDGLARDANRLLRDVAHAMSFQRGNPVVTLHLGRAFRRAILWDHDGTLALLNELGDDPLPHAIGEGIRDVLRSEGTPMT